MELVISYLKENTSPFQRLVFNAVQEKVAVYFENYMKTTELINVTVGGPCKLPLCFNKQCCQFVVGGQKKGLSETFQENLRVTKSWRQL
jgi:hypothetical protein